MCLSVCVSAVTRVDELLRLSVGQAPAEVNLPGGNIRLPEQTNKPWPSDNS